MLKDFKTLKRIVSVILIASFALFSFISCAGSNQAIIVTENYYSKGKLGISSNILNYYVSLTKTNILSQYYVQQDYPTIWSEVFPEDYKAMMNFDREISTFGDYAKYQALETVKQMLAVKAYCEENKLTLTKDMKNAVDTAVKDLIANSYGNSKFNFNTALSVFTLNEKLFKEIKTLSYYYELASNDLFGTGGKRPVTDLDVQSFYVDNYSRVEHIYIANSSSEYDDEGNPVEFTEEDLAAKAALADEIIGKLETGEGDFAELQAEYSEDGGAESYPNGYSLSIYDTGVPFKDDAFDMEMGAYRLVESSYGWHIIKRVELLTDLTEFYDTIVSDIQYDVFTEVLTVYVNSMTVDEDEYSAIDVTTAPVMFDYAALAY